MSQQSIEEILTGLNKKELVEILCRQAEEDPKLRAMLFSQFGTDIGSETKDAYKTLIRQMLQSGEDRKGYLDYQSTKRVMRDVCNLLSQAESLEERHEINRAIAIAQATIEVLKEALQQTDDSGGTIRGGMQQAFEIL